MITKHECSSTHLSSLGDKRGLYSGHCSSNWPGLMLHCASVSAACNSSTENDYLRFITPRTKWALLAFSSGLALFSSPPNFM